MHLRLSLALAAPRPPAPSRRWPPCRDGHSLPGPGDRRMVPWAPAISAKVVPPGTAGDISVDRVPCLPNNAHPMRRLRIALGAAAFWPAILAACASSDAGASEAGAAGAQGASGMGNPEASVGEHPDASVTAPAIDPSREARTLSGDEQGALCDWAAGVLGGYGQTADCGSGISVANYQNRTECVRTAFPSSCTMTVAEFETCIRAEGPSHGCVLPSDECRKFIAC
jgi:hypothetical protein